MEEKNINYQDALFVVAQDMAKANSELQTNISAQPDCSAIGLIRSEIARGKTAAIAWKRMCLVSNTYTHTSKFPLETYEGLPEDFILKLELSDIYLYKNKEDNTAVIRIVFHF